MRENIKFMKQWLFLLPLLYILQGNTPQNSPAMQEKRFAFIIDTLTKTMNDATDVAQALKGLNFEATLKTHLNLKSVSQTIDSKDYFLEIKGVKFKMIYVQGGSFAMGSNDGGDDEKPIHNVTLTDYYMAETEVTQELYEAVMGTNPSNFKGQQRPVEQVSWEDVQAFIQKLNKMIPTDKPRIHLPTEAQWEYAARGGKHSKDYKYAGSNDLNEVAWYNSSETHPVKGKKANELGFYDMSGNAWEWCADDYASDAYTKVQSSNVINPIFNSNEVKKNHAKNPIRVIRGGSWDYFDYFCRVSCRFNNLPRYRYNFYGFRLGAGA